MVKLMKFFLRCEEPLQMKGGLVIAAYKGGAISNVNNYRSLLLSSHLGKALRRSVRQRIVPFYSKESGAFHCSVKQGGCVSHAPHGPRLTLSAARSRGVSAGVIFLDIRLAYYRVARELVIDMEDEGRSFERMIRFFQLGDTHFPQNLGLCQKGLQRLL